MKLRFKKTIRQTLAENASGMQHYKTLYGISDQGKAHLDVIQGAVDEAAVRYAKRKPRQPSLIASEAKTQKAIISYLLLHPRVVMVSRINSGAVYGDAGQFIKFHTIMLPSRFKAVRMRVVDLDVMLTGPDQRMAIEVKRPGWTKPTDDREREQANYLEHVRAHGGLGIFATSIDDVQEALNGK